jgi:cytosine/adenosine deaminase-related metal-dependent hydrolase
MQLISADKIYLISKSPLEKGVIVLDKENNIIDLLKNNDGINEANIKYYEGSISPGFINAHCHLELSHLLNKCIKHKGLVNFLQEVVKKRNQFTEEEIFSAVENADKGMYNNGIVAVGDICNSSVTIETKKRSKIYYHNFIELIGFQPEYATNVFQKGMLLYNEFVSTGMSTSYAPHAPYSVSDELKKLIFKNNYGKITSLHNQECDAENDFFKYGTGDFLSLYKNFGIDIPFHQSSGKSSIHTFIKDVDFLKKIALVHNTYIETEDIDYVSQYPIELFFCICVNANLFIENKLPPIDLLLNKNQKIILGTDSLASNHQLSILNEIEQILKSYTNLKLDDVLKWATLNGAEFLGIQNRFGSIEIGKNPGLVVFDEKEFRLKDVIF